MPMSQTFLPGYKHSKPLIVALKNVYRREGDGKLLNDCYTLDEYATRRDYAISASGWSIKEEDNSFIVARSTAEDLFGTSKDQKLSVQEVRRREVALSILPLLPLPTTTNTETIDDFASYPAYEWPPFGEHTSTAPDQSLGASLSALSAPPVFMSSDKKYPASVSVAAGVSSLRNRGMHVPVKESAQRGAKRSSETLDSLSGSTIIKAGAGIDGSSPAGSLESGRKKAKLTPALDAKLATLPRLDTDLLSGSPPVELVLETPKTLSSLSLLPTKNPLIKTHIDEVLDGIALPATPDDALAIAHLRLSRLRAVHAAARKKSRSKNIRQTSTPDFMPEFFDKSRFPVGAEDDQVRCICGVVVDDQQDMLACDACGVWQHIACMGEAVPEDVETGRYECQMCDPWAHRHLIAAIRVQSND